MTESLAAAPCRIDGVAEGESAFRPGPGFCAGGKEIAHFDGPDAIDLRLTRAEIRPALCGGGSPSGHFAPGLTGRTSDPRS